MRKAKSTAEKQRVIFWTFRLFLARAYMSVGISDHSSR